ncbi:MAG: acyl carrier protein [bacterium]|nr:acyl carrier protein [bacterium]
MDDVQKRVNDIIIEALQDKISYEDITPEKELVGDLMAESMEILEIVLALGIEFNIKTDKENLKELRTIEDIYAYIREHGNVL